MTSLLSPISQRIIDGEYYWDRIGQNWHRLLHRSSQSVVGHIRLLTNQKWTAVYHEPHFNTIPTKRHERANLSGEAARQFIEEWCAAEWPERNRK